MTDKMIYHCILALHNSQKRGVARIRGLSKCSWNDFRKLSEREFKELEQEAIELAETYKVVAEMLHQITGCDNTLRTEYYPLFEIPTPHGDLIDRDDLLAYFDRKAKGKTAEEALKLLYTALKAYPAVIEKENAQ